MKKLLSKKAFTLVEVVIATAIMGLLIAAVMALFGPVKNLVDDMNGDVNINTTTDSIQNYFHSRLNKSIGYNVDIYDGEAEGLVANEDGSIGMRINKMREKAGGDGSISTYCILLKHEDDGYFIYDLGKVENGADYDEKRSSLNDYRLFNKEFYCDAKYRFTFSTETTQNDAAYWYKIGITPYDEDGFQLLETRNSAIKLLNVKSTPVSSDDLKTEEGYFDAENSKTPTIAIIYNVKNYTDTNNLPEAS